MSTAPSDRHLLFGVLALQMDLIDRDAVVAALHVWVFDKTRTLGDILVAQHVLNPDERELLDALVQKHLDRHRGDVEKSLAAIAVSTALRQQLNSLADPDMQASLGRLPTLAGQAEPGRLTMTTAEPGPRTLTSVELRCVGGLRYQVLRPHDKGGIGEVFVALDQELNREVALKEMQERHVGDARSRGRFVREAEITGNLEHPGIVPVYGLGQYTDGRPYYAMRFIRGETLKDAIVRFHRTSDCGARSPEFELRALLMRFVAVCNTLAYAHSRGVIHRDVKPANIMLGQYGETLVVDWGMAKAVGEEGKGSDALAEPALVLRLADSIATQVGATMGTPVYMSPEQASGRLDLLGSASDIYSLGATLYTLLTGRPPIAGKDTAEVLRKAQKGEWLPPRQIKPDVPPALDAICRKAMATAPSARYRTALELAADVEHWLADEAVAAYREPWTAQSRRWIRRHRTLVSTAVGILVVALMATTVGLVIVSDAERKQKEARQTAETKEGEARFNQYVAEMNLAQREYEANNIGHLRELLAAQIPREGDATDLRDFEWHYWQHRVQRELGTLEGHTGRVYDVCYSPDGRRLASASQDQTVRIWDAATGKELLTLKGHTSVVHRVCFSPDGQRLASASYDRTLRVWDAATAEQLLVLKEHQGLVQGVCFSPDGRRLASASQNEIYLWDAANGKKLLTLKGHTRAIRGLTFRFDGRRLASASEDGTARVWDADNGKELLALKGITGFVYGVAFSPNGRRLATAKWSQIHVWDANTGQELRVLQGHTGLVLDVCFSPDGLRLASASGDRTARVWEIATGKELFTLTGHTDTVSGVAYSPDGRRLATAGDRTVRLWPADSGREFLAARSPEGARGNVAFSPDGRRLAFFVHDPARRSSPVRVVETTTGKELVLLQGATGKPTDAISHVAFSPNGEQLATSVGQTVRLWDAATGKELLVFDGHANRVVGVAFSPDGRRLASACDQVVRIWDAATGKELLALQGSKGFPFGVAYSPDDRRLAVPSSDGMVRIWDIAAGAEPRVLQGHDGVVFSVAFSPDGKRLASTGFDWTVRIWDVVTGQQLHSLKGHGHRVGSVAFSPNGRRLASASTDQTIRLWDTATGRELLALKGHLTGVVGVAFSPDGRRLASTSQDTTVRVWEALSVPDSLWRQRDLVRRVESLFEEHLLRAEVLAVLRNDSSLDEADRQFARDVAQTWREDLRSWNDKAWSIVKVPGLSKDAYGRAFRQAATTLRLLPADSNILTTLGVAQYRLARYADALATLTKAEKLHAVKEGSIPADLAFLAMSQHQLGKKAEAKVKLGRLRQAMMQPRWAKDAEAVGFVREAKEVIEGSGTNNKR